MEGPQPYASAVDPTKDATLPVGTAARATKIGRDERKREQEKSSAHNDDDDQPGDRVMLSALANHRLEQDHASHPSVDGPQTAATADSVKAQLGRHVLLSAAHPIWMHLTDRLDYLRRQP